MISLHNLKNMTEENFEDDEGAPDESSDDEDYDEVTDNEELTEADYEITSANKNFIEEKIEKCSIPEFLSQPSGSRLLGINELYAEEDDDYKNDYKNLTKDLIYEKIGKVSSYRQLMDLYLILASCLEDSSHSRTMDVLNKCSDDLFKMCFSRVQNESFVINYLLARGFREKFEILGAYFFKF